MPHADAAPRIFEDKVMSPQATTHELKTQLLNGWIGSLSLHGILVLCFLPLFRLSPPTVPNEPFHWNVALVQSTEMTENLNPPKSTEQTVLKQTDRAPVPVEVSHPIRKAASSIGRVAAVEPTVKTAEPKFQPDVPSSDISQLESASTSTSEQPTPNLIQAKAHALQQADPSTGSTTQEPPIQETAATPSSGENTPPAAEIARPAPATTSDVAAVSAIRSDYSWLQQAIFRRLEELKRSSRPSLDESRPLKVMVKAVVSKEGNLLDSAVVKSSGFDRIDQEAMALVQQAFPLQLDRSLDRGQIVMRIPITYSRE